MKNRNYTYKATSKHHWTVSAKECYERGLNCQGCFYDQFFKESGKKCLMKKTVLELVRLLGKPQGITLKQIIQDENE